MSQQWLVRVSATGQLCHVCVDGDGPDRVYRQVAFSLFNMLDAWDDDFDTGNVDVDLIKLETPAAGITTILRFPGDEDYEEKKP